MFTLRAGIAPVAGIEGRGLNLEFLHGIGVRNAEGGERAGFADAAGTLESRHGNAVHLVVVVGRGRAVHGNRLSTFSECRGGVIDGAVGARGKTEEVYVVAGGQGNLGDVVYHRAHRAIAGLNGFDVRLNGDFLGLRAHGQGLIQGPSPSQ